jgi:hypothetical protein
VDEAVDSLSHFLMGLMMVQMKDCEKELLGERW